VSDYSRLPGFSLSSDKIEETVERTEDMKNGAAVMNYLVKDEDNIAEIELPEPAYDNDSATGANDGTSDINTAEKEVQSVLQILIIWILIGLTEHLVNWKVKNLQRYVQIIWTAFKEQNHHCGALLTTR